MSHATPRAPVRHPLRVTLAYLAREKLHELRHPDRASLFGLATLLLLGLWFEVLLILALRHGFREIADLAAAQGLVPRDMFVSIYFVFLAGLTQVIILFGFARAQTVSLERLRFLPLSPLHIYLVELSSKLLAALGAVLFLLPLAVAVLPVAGGGPGRAALFAAAALLTAVALAEAAVLLLLLIEGTTASGRIVFRLLFASRIAQRNASFSK